MHKDNPVNQALQGTDSRLERLIHRTDGWTKGVLPPGFLFFIVPPLTLCGLVAWLRF